MKLLFDENLSRRLVPLLASEFPGSSHPDLTQMRGTADADIWSYARGDYVYTMRPTPDDETLVVRYRLVWPES